VVTEGQVGGLHNCNKRKMLCLKGTFWADLDHGSPYGSRLLGEGEVKAERGPCDGKGITQSALVVYRTIYFDCPQTQTTTLTLTNEP
jgi:hypothetical protein